MFLPVSKKDMHDRGIEQLDFVLVTGDAYIDHPSFGTAIIGRVLERAGYKVGILSQPEWKDCKSFKSLGKPRLAFLIGSGNIDSMVNHYTVSKRRRKSDAYTPGGQAGKRPDRAVIVYAQRAREAYKDVPIIIGGIEASLRRLAHYDYWDNKVRRSILLDSKADLLMYGMGEKSVVEIADALDSGIEVKHLGYIRGTVYKTSSLENIYDDYIVLPSYKEVTQSKEKYAMSFNIQSKNIDPYTAKILVEDYDGMKVVQNPPAYPLSQLELDSIYHLPFEYKEHPMYHSIGEIPALSEIQFSITSNRGCFGSCNFCALTFHQGRIVQGRSKQSMIEEAKKMTLMSDFKGYIHDVGGPTANFSKPPCKKSSEKGTCNNKYCLHPTPCKNLEVDHHEYMETLKELRSLPKVKKVFIRSGIRYDYLLSDKNRKKILKDICEHYVSGQLRVAPEHISNHVLDYMGKPRKEVYEKFLEGFYKESENLGKKQYVVPYFMSSHPGSSLEDAIELALYLKKIHYIPEQVQDFYPTPATLSTCMYYTELDPRTMKRLYVPKTKEEKGMQRALLQYNKKENYDLVYKALIKAKRTDLIGYSQNCLIKPKKTDLRIRKK